MKRRKIPYILNAIQWSFPKLELLSTKLAVSFFEKIFFTPFRYRTPEKELETESLARSFKINSDGKSIQAYEWGDEGTPYVLVIHGWAGRATQFRKFIPVFNNSGYRIIGFDGPAHGRSEGKKTNLFEFEAVLIKLIKLKGAPAGIIAHSFGGGAALMAIMNGLPVKKLINIASPTMSDEIIKTYLKAIHGSWETGKRFKELVLKKYGKPFEEFTAMHFIKHITDLELLIVHDVDDENVSIIQAEELVKQYPKAKLLTTHGLGHNRILKEDAVIQAGLDFIRK